jgi:hypothetical protein
VYEITTGLSRDTDGLGGRGAPLNAGRQAHIDDPILS